MLEDDAHGALGGVYVIFGKVGGIGDIELDDLTADQGFVILGAPPTNPYGGDGLETTASGAGDVNGDGYDDIIIGMYRDDPSSAYIVYGNATGFGAAHLGAMTASQGSRISVPIPYSSVFGASVAGVGDVNNDGYDDVIAGNWADTAGVGENAGAAFLLFGSAQGIGSFDVTTMTASQGYRFDGTLAGDLAGFDVAGLGDINGDGIDDLAIGLPGANPVPNSIYQYEGKVVVRFGNAAGDFSGGLAPSAAQGFVIEGYLGSGTHISGAGDINGDGYQDILIGNSGGAFVPAHVVFGKAGGFGTIDLSALSPADGFAIDRGSDGNGNGDVAAAGDVNGDGFDDIALGFNSYYPGTAYVFFGSATLSSLTLGVSDGWIVSRSTFQDTYFGRSLGSADLNFDGFSDLLASEFVSDVVGENSGTVYAIYGQLPSGAVVRSGTVASQTLAGGDGDDTLSGLGGDDELYGNGGNDTLSGGDGNDNAWGGTGDDTVYGDDGNDTLDGGLGADVMAGGDDDDIYYVDSAGDMVIEAADGGDDQVIASLTWTMTAGQEIETLTTSDAAGTQTINFNGNEYGNRIEGNAGFNNLYGKAGNDELIGNGGNDFLEGGQGDDLLDGGADTDVASYMDATNGVSIDLSLDIAQDTGWGLDELISIESLLGSFHDDVLTGSSRGERISGRSGNDTIHAMAGDDEVIGDLTNGTLDGGDGTDWLAYYYSFGVTVDLALTGAQTISLGQTQTLANFECLLGSYNGADVLKGDDNANTLLGLDGDDQLYGRGGVDQLGGNLGNDTLYGGDGDDNMFGEGLGEYTSINGSGNDHLVGGNGNDFLSGGGGLDWLEGEAGDDTLRIGAAGAILDGGAGFDTVSFDMFPIPFPADPAAPGLVIDMAIPANGTSWASGATFISIERVVGSANADVIFGAAGDETIEGRNGHDTLIGRAGNDTMLGGFGDDVFFVDSAADVVGEEAGQGTDRVVASVSYVLAAGAYVETIETGSASGTGAIDLTGSNAANTILGNNGANSLSGGGGDDTLHGFAGADYLFGGPGLDNLYGGTGDDAYFIGSADGDRVWEFGSEGNDLVSTAVDYTLPDIVSVERLEAGTLGATTPLSLGGSNLANVIIGNAGNNVLRGFQGDDTLHGLGGDDFLIGDEGADVMYGGAGNDTYYVNTAGDRIFENPGEGTADRAATSVSLTLPNEAEVEILEAVNLTGTSIGELGGSQYPNSITGDAGNNLLRGYAGNDTLNGYTGNDTLIGDEGDDTMIGGLGNDVYFVDSTGDIVTELANQGTDRVATSATYVLASGASIETLETTSLTGTGAINLTGSDTANTITGNAGNNKLYGMGGNDLLLSGDGQDELDGGAGADRMEGGLGGDKYYVDDAGDVIVEFSQPRAEALDFVYVSTNYALTAGAQIEYLIARDTSGTADINLIGNELDQAVVGTNGNNVLDGKHGQDTLAGLGGSDTFQFSEEVDNPDQIEDFVSGVDHFALYSGAFAGLPVGALAASAFVVGTAAVDADDRVIYDNATGKLYFDADGNGAGAAFQFALLVGAPTVMAGDFLVI